MSQHKRIDISHVPYEDLKINVNQQIQATPPQVQQQILPEIPQKNISTMAEDSQTKIFIMAGAAAGIMEHCIMYPVDSIKTRMQSLRPHPQAQYRSVSHAFQKIINTEGFARPMRGVNIVAFGAGPAHALYFGSYETVKKMLGNNGTGGHFHLANAVAGGVATILHDGTMNPVEVIKQRIQVYGSPYRGVFDCARCVIKTEGIGAFYRSFSTQLTMNIPFQCTHFVTYEFIRETLNPEGGYNPKTHLFAGAAAGGIAAALTTPLDVAKTLLNTQESNAISAMIKNKSGQKLLVSGMVAAMKTIYQLRGFRGYFQGLQARVIYQAPSCAISWSVYEFFKNYLLLKISDEEMMELTV